MKFKIFLPLFLIAAFSVSVHAQKKAINEDVYSKWNRVDSHDLSEDGRYVTYKYTNLVGDTYRSGGAKYYLFDNATKKTMILDSVSNLNFCANGQWLMYNEEIGGKSKSMLMRMRDKKIIEWTKESSPHFFGGKNIVSYNTNKGEDLVILNLSNNDSIVMKGVRNANFYDDYSMVIYRKESDASSDIYYGKVAKNAKHTLLYRDSTKTLSGFNFYEDQKKGSFELADKNGGKDDCNLFYNFDLNSGKVRLTYDRNDLKVEPNLSINKSSVSRNSNKGRYISFEVYPYDISKKKDKNKKEDKPKKDESFELELWSWNDSISQNIQAVSGYREAKFSPFIYVYDTQTKKSYPLIKSSYSSIFNSTSASATHLFYSDEKPYSKSNDWEHDQRADLYLVNLANGESKMFKQRTTQRAKWSPNGDYIVYFDSEERAWVSLEPKSYTFRKLSDDIPYPVHDEFYDKPNPVPAYGIAAWSKDGNTVLLYDKCDVWAVDITGKNKTYCYTRNYGRKNNYSLRLLNPSYSDLTLDLTKPYDLEMLNMATMDAGVGTYRHRVRSRKILKDHSV